MIETGWLMIKSLFYRDEPVPMDRAVFPQEERLVTVKKIA